MHDGTPFFIINPLYHRYFFHSAVISLAILVILYDRRFSFRISGFEIFFVLYLLINLASIFYSIDKFRSEFKFFNLLFGFIIFILGFNIVQNVKQIATILKILIFSSTLLGLLGIYQGIFGPIKMDIIDFVRDFGHRALGTFENPNFFAGFLTLVIPPACYFSLFGDEKKIRICGAFSVVVLGNALLWTGSRGGLIAIGSTLMLLLLFLHRDRRLQELTKTALIILVTIAMYLIGDAVSAKVAETRFEKGSTAYNLIYPKDSELDKVDSRLDRYKKSLPLIWAHPIFGVGLSTYEHSFIKHYPEHEMSRTKSVAHAHNIFLNIAVEVGLLGFFFFGMMLISLFRQSGFLTSKSRGYGIDSMSMFGLLGIFAFLVHNLFDYTWMPQPFQIAFFLIASLIVKQGMLQGKLEDGVRTPVCHLKGKIPLIGMLLVAAFLLVVSVFRPLYAFHLYDRSVYLYGTGNLSQGLPYAQRAVDTIPEHSVLHANLSKFYLRQWEQDKDVKNYKKAIAEIKKAISLNPTESYFYSLLGEARDRFKDLGGAATAYVKAIELNANHIPLYHKVAVNYMGLKDYEHALMWLKRARTRLQKMGAGAKALPILFENYVRTAIAYDELGQYAKARIYYEKTLKLAASDSIKCDIGPLLERLEYLEKAIKANSKKAAFGK